MKARFYFDIISPFAYLFVAQLHRLPASLELEYRPLLLAALLDHYGHRGPAEIPSKRRFSYRHVLWTAQRLGVPLRFPPAHPFNPLALLRLAVLLENDAAAMGRLFRAVWRDGALPDSPAAVNALGESLGIQDAAAAIVQPAVKARLRSNSDEALREGVFGVPSVVVNGELFWGADSMDMLIDYLADPGLFDREEFRHVDTLPVGAERKLN